MKTFKPWEKNPNLLVPWFLMASYAYYCEGKAIMKDSDFDNLVSLLRSQWDTVVHPHKHLITTDMLDACTGYSIEYPTIVKFATMELINEQKTP